MLTEDQKWDYILKLDEKLLAGGVILSEWTTFLVKDAETAFCKGSYLASILAAQAAMECHLRYEYYEPQEIKGWGFYKLIENCSLTEDLKKKLHEIRIYRNRWVHVGDPVEDKDLLEKPEYYENELENMAKKAIEAMLKVLYLEQWI